MLTTNDGHAEFMRTDGWLGRVGDLFAGVGSTWYRGVGSRGVMARPACQRGEPHDAHRAAIGVRIQNGAVSHRRRVIAIVRLINQERSNGPKWDT